jgi:N-acetylglucosamine-6-phosphate deacetylase
VSQASDADSLRLLGTEQVRPELANLDQLSVEELVEVMCSDVRRVPEALAASQDEIVKAVTGIVERLARGGRLVYVGAGTAGRLGMLDAAEAGPTFNIDDGQVVGVMAGGTTAFGVPIENAEDDFDGGANAMAKLNVGERDCVVGISASGRTPYVLGAIDAANKAGALSVAIVSNPATPLADQVDCPIEVVMGAELVAGSTRMNAGTAQKIVLNVISTATMVRLGKTYGNLMIDLRPTNEKLRDRSVRIVADITASTSEESLAALEASEWNTKVASVMLVGSLGAIEAKGLLRDNEGQLRSTLDSLRSATSPNSLSRTHQQHWTRLGVAAALVDGTLVPGDVALRHGEIMAVGLSNPGTGIAIPGLVDAQINGYGGVDILDADVDEIIAMGGALLRDGVIAYQPTLITSSFERVERAAHRITEARRRQKGGAKILGIHLEGPFLSIERAGTHPTQHLRSPDMSLLEKLLDIGDVTMLTLAPELPGALQLIGRCRQRDIVVSLGHSAATAAQAELGFDAGATCVTHLYNAMEPLSARVPGLAGASLARKGVTLQLIADGVHVADEMLLMTFAAAQGRCSLVSDTIAAAACDESTVQLGDVTVYINDGVARRDDGTIAGSVGKLRDGLTRLARLGISHVDALNAVTWRPAHLLAATDVVSLRPGTPANFFVLDEQLALSKHVVAGKINEVA